MVEKGLQIKVVLLLQPQKLLYRNPVLQLLIVAKLGNSVDMEEEKITAASVNRYFKHFDTNTRNCILKFSDENINKEKAVISFQSEKAGFTGKKAQLLADKALARFFMKQLGYLKSLPEGISWYHRVTQPNSNKLITAPCQYNSLSVNLLFDCYLEDDSPKLVIYVKYAGETIPLTSFRRFYFLLLKQNEYFHLNTSAFEALEWLEEQDVSRFSVEAFMQEIVTPLEKMQQVVNTEKLITKEVLEVAPERRLLLSELNNSFLMMTPQFIYDGFVIEGAYEPSIEKQVNGKPIIVKRHEQTEKEFSEWLRKLHPNFERQYNGYYYLSFADAQKKHWFLKAYHQMLEQDIQIIGMDLLRHFRYSPFKESTQISVKEQQGDFVLATMTLMFGKEKIPLHELQKMLLAGQKVVMLKDGSLGVLSDDWLQNFGIVVKHARVKGDNLMLPRWIALSVDEEGEIAVLHKTLNQEWVAKWRRWCNEEMKMYPLSPAMQVSHLRNYQQRGYDWLNVLAEAGGSACLADDMGLGKTLQAICFIASRLQQYPKGRCLIVCSASLIYNWQQEFEKFAPTIHTVTYHGGSRDKKIFEKLAGSVVITSYGTLRQDIEIICEESFDVVVLDESHQIKNPSTLIAKAVMQLNSQTRIALSGTPVMNSTQDLYAQINFLLPGLLGSSEFFRKEYSIPIEQRRDEEKAKKLQRIIAPFVLRRTKEQVATDLPDKIESVLWCEMGHDQRTAYESIKDQVRSSVFLEIENGGLQKGKISILAGLTKLRQICNSAELIPDQDLFTYDSIKTEVLLEKLTKIIPEHRVLVFSQFTSMLDLLERDLKKLGIRYQRLDGSTAISKRQDLVNNFQNQDSDIQLFLLSLKAGNAGLTLTAADYVFLFDPWWNVAVENQAIDRTHRIGQNKQVFAYRMICKGTVEEKILYLQQKKKKMADNLVSAEDGFMKTLTLEDVKYLLQ